MNHSATMRFVQRIRDLRAILRYLLQRQPTLLQPLRQRLALHAFHHQIVQTVLTSHVIQHADVRMVQAGDVFGFALEALPQCRIIGQMRRKNLEGDNAL